MIIKALFTASAVLLSTAVWAQDSTSHEGHTATMDMSQPVGDQGPSSKAFAEANAKMHADMAIEFSGDTDVDFVRGMIAHHQGAIDMAKIQLQYGKDPEIRKLAEEVIKAQEGEIAMIGEEAKAQYTRDAKNLTSLSQVLALRRESVRLNGEFGQLKAQIAATRARIEEIGLQRIQIDQSMRAEVSTELRDLETREGELRSEEIALIEDLQRVDIRAPVAGVVHKLAVHTTGGVISPAEALMEIVPREAKLVVQAQIRPDDVDQLQVGQPAAVRFTAFNRNTTPEFDGRLSRLSADLEVDERTGAAFYRADIAVDKAKVAEHAGLDLVPGMPAEVFVRTGERTVLSWLMKPISDHAARALRGV